MATLSQRFSTLLPALLFWLTAGANATSPCPPIPSIPLLSLDNPEWVIAQVTVTDQPADVPAYGSRAATVSVDRVYVGELNSSVIVVREDSGFLDCSGERVPNREEDIGSTFLLGIAGPNVDGSYGGYRSLHVARVEDGRILPAIPGFQDVGDNRTLDEFSAFINTLTPRAETDNWDLTLSPRLPGPADKVSVNVQGKSGLCLASIRTNAVMVDNEQATVRVSFRPVNYDAGDCRYKAPVPIELPPLRAPDDQDSYTISIYEENETADAPPFRATNLIAEIDYPLRADAPTDSYAEVPAQGSVQSGIGIIRGWACEAQRVEIQFNELPRTALAYGMARIDTREVCGDSNNGYGAVYAWGLLGPGQHTMRTYIDGTLTDTVEFEVAGLDNAFATGLDATYELDDFPAPGQSVTIRWSQAAQNFIIVDAQ